MNEIKHRFTIFIFHMHKVKICIILMQSISVWCHMSYMVLYKNKGRERCRNRKSFPDLDFTRDDKKCFIFLSLLIDEEWPQNVI